MAPPALRRGAMVALLVGAGVLIGTMAPTWRQGSGHQSAGPVLSRVQITPDVSLELRDWRPLLQPGRGRRLPLVLLTGLGNTAAVYDDLAPRLAGHQPVVGLTRRGFGGSTAPADGYDVPSRVEDLRQALDRLGLKQVVLVGHSIAGDELTAFGGRYPERVAGLVYLDAALNRYSPADSDQTLACLQRLVAQANVKVPAELVLQAPDGAWLGRSYGAMARLTAPLAIPPTELAAQSAWLPGGGLGPPATAEYAMAALSQHTERYRPNYRPLTMPLLALYGSRFEPDPRRPAMSAAQRSAADTCIQGFLASMKRMGVDDLRAQRPDAQIHVWGDASHYLFLEHPQRTAAAIRRFVSALRQPAG